MLKYIYFRKGLRRAPGNWYLEILDIREVREVRDSRDPS